jgi:NAD(P)-dependent dehydrogenase (short-subunit alcohol dehydrogenase family)
MEFQGKVVLVTGGALGIGVRHLSLGLPRQARSCCFALALAALARRSLRWGK